MTELIDVCGGSVTADFQVRRTVKGRAFKTVALRNVFSLLDKLNQLLWKSYLCVQKRSKTRKLILKISYKTQWQQR